jgi:hypothetical protein
MEDGLIPSPLSTRDNTTRDISMPRVGFEPTILVFERSKTVFTLYRVTTAIGVITITLFFFVELKLKYKSYLCYIFRIQLQRSCLQVYYFLLRKGISCIMCSYLIVYVYTKFFVPGSCGSLIIYHTLIAREHYHTPHVDIVYSAERLAFNCVASLRTGAYAYNLWSCNPGQQSYFTALQGT